MHQHVVKSLPWDSAESCQYEAKDKDALHWCVFVVQCEAQKWIQHC